MKHFRAIAILALCALLGVGALTLYYVGHDSTAPISTTVPAQTTQVYGQWLRNVQNSVTVLTISPSGGSELTVQTCAGQTTDDTFVNTIVGDSFILSNPRLSLVGSHSGNALLISAPAQFQGLYVRSTPQAIANATKALKGQCHA